MAEGILIEGPLPMLLNLGDFGSPAEDMIGWTYIYELDDGRKKLSVILDEKTSKAFTSFTDIFELKGIGFAGVKRREL